jgi:hypothetical protein
VAKRRKKPLSTGGWLLVGAALAGLWFIGAGPLFLVGGGVATGIGGAKYVRKHGMPRLPSKPRTRSAKRKPKPTRTRPADRRMDASRMRQAPVTAPGELARIKRTPILGTQRCSAACRKSTKPVRNKQGKLMCDCPCGGSQHGKYQTGSRANVLASKTPKGAKDRERAARYKASNERWAEAERKRQARYAGAARGGTATAKKG